MPGLPTHLVQELNVGTVHVSEAKERNVLPLQYKHSFPASVDWTSASAWLYKHLDDNMDNMSKE